MFYEDNGTYAIVKVTSHSCRVMVNLSISDYFEVMRHPLRTYLNVFSFLAKCQDLPFTWIWESTIWLFMSLVRCKVLPQQGICTMGIFTFSQKIRWKLWSKWYFILLFYTSLSLVVSDQEESQKLKQYIFLLEKVIISYQKMSPFFIRKFLFFSLRC